TSRTRLLINLLQVIHAAGMTPQRHQVRGNEVEGVPAFDQRPDRRCIEVLKVGLLAAAVAVVARTMKILKRGSNIRWNAGCRLARFEVQGVGSGCPSAHLSRHPFHHAERLTVGEMYGILQNFQGGNVCEDWPASVRLCPLPTSD